MPRIKIQSPGTVLSGLLEKHGLNVNRLAKAIGMSAAMVRLISRDETPVSISAAYRFAKFFKTKPEYWLNLQLQYDVAKAAADKSLAKEVSAISDVSRYFFVRKSRKPNGGKPAKKAASPGGNKRGRKPGKASAGKKATLADKRKKAVKAPGAKPAARNSKPAKPSTGRRGRPPVAAKASKKQTVVVRRKKSVPSLSSQPAGSSLSSAGINEPMI